MIYIALLRGINVSGQKKIKMADLRTYLGDAGLQDVKTYIQSGNIVFKSENADKTELAQKISDEIKEAYGFHVPVLVLTADYLQSVIEQNTYFKAGKDISKLYVIFLSEHPSQEKIATLEAVDYSPEEFTLHDTHLDFYFPNGYGRSKLNNNFFERKLKVSATTRNWKTINKLLDMATDQ